MVCSAGNTSTSASLFCPKTQRADAVFNSKKLIFRLILSPGRVTSAPHPRKHPAPALPPLRVKHHYSAPRHPRGGTDPKSPCADLRFVRHTPPLRLPLVARIENFQITRRLEIRCAHPHHPASTSNSNQYASAPATLLRPARTRAPACPLIYLVMYASNNLDQRSARPR